MKTSLITTQPQSLSPYLAVLETEITADLARIIEPEKLRDEVRKAIAKQISQEASQAINEFHSLLLYGGEAAIQQAEAKARRYAQYLIDLLAIRDNNRLASGRDSVRGLLSEDSAS